MGRHRVFSLRTKRSTRVPRWIGKGIHGFSVIWLVLSLTACAQQSDLVKVEMDLENKIRTLHRGKRALTQTLEQAKQNIEASKAMLAEQKDELDELKKARAQQKTDLRSLRETTSAKFTDVSETQSHRLDQVTRKLAELTKKDASLHKLLEQRDADRSTQIAALRKDVEQVLSKRAEKVDVQFADFRGSLVEFKKALAAVDTRLVRERNRATSAETAMQQAFTKQQQAFQAKLDADTQALKTYLETDVTTAIQSVNTDLDTALTDVTQQLNAKIKIQAEQLSKLNAKLGTELAALQRTDTQHGKNQEAMTRTLAQLRDAFGTTGTQLGTKLDSQGQDLARTAKQVRQLQSQHAALAKKLNADTQALQRYFEKDIRPSLASIAKVVEQEKGRVAKELARLETGLQEVDQTIAADVTQTQTQVDVQAKYLRELDQTVAGMREVLNSTVGLLGKRGDEQTKQLGQATARLDHLERELSSEAAKQAENIQAVSTHLNEVTASVKSVVQSVEQFKKVFAARLTEHAAQLQEQARRVSVSAEAAVQRLQKALEANVKQGNALAQSIGRLKEASQAMGTKLGSKVDEHEAQLIELQNALTQSQKSMKPKPRSP